MRRVCHANLRSLLTHLLQGQDLVMTTEHSEAFTKLAASSCYYLTYDIFTQSAQCGSLYVNVAVTAVWYCWANRAAAKRMQPTATKC